MSETCNQPAGYTLEVVERGLGYIVWKIVLVRGSHHFCVSPLVRADWKHKGVLVGRMEIAHSLPEARVIGEKFKQAAIEEGYAVE
jgi:hypothetical protein